MFSPRRITRYVFGQLFVPAALGMLLFTFVLLMNHLMLVAQKAITLNLPAELTMKLFAFELPKLLVMTIPMGVLLGALIAVGRISADHEWVAIQSAGLGPWALLRPVGLFGLLAATVSFGMYTVVFPRTNMASRALQAEIARSVNLSSNLRPRIFVNSGNKTVLFVDEIRPGTHGRLEGVLTHRSDVEGGYDELALAQLGDLYPTGSGDGSQELELRRGVSLRYKLEDPLDTVWAPFFEQVRIQLPPPRFIHAFRENALKKTVLDMGPQELLEELETVRAIEEPLLRELRVRAVMREIHARLALPAAAFLFAMLAVPMGISRVRSGKGAGFALASVVIVVYWLVYTFGRDQADSGKIPVALGVWAANGVILVWILVAYWRLRRRSGAGPLVLLRRAGVVSAKALVAVGHKTNPARRSSPDALTIQLDNGEPMVVPGASNRIVNLIDRHIALQFLRVLSLSLLSFYAVYMLVELRDTMESALQNKQSTALVFEYLLYFSPGMLKIVLPISTLVAAVVTFTLLARSGELTAVMASGISLLRATVPVLWLTAAVCVVFFLVEDRVVPVANNKSQQLKDQLSGRNPRTHGRVPGGRWTFGSQGRLYHYGAYDRELQQFQELSVFTIDRATPRILSHLHTSGATWDGDGWELSDDSWIYRFPAESEPRFEDLDAGSEFPLDPPGNFAQRERLLRPDSDEYYEGLPIKDLRELIARLDDKGYDTTRMRVSLYSKIVHPTTPLVMVILGLPFAFRIGRRGSLYGIGIALLLVIVYWAAFAVFRALGIESLLPPLLAAWTPNVLFTIFGLYLLLHVRT